MGAIPHRSILSLCDIFSSFPLILFWIIAEWFLISRLKLVTMDGISSGLIFSLNLLLSVSSFSLKTLRLFSVRFIACFRSFSCLFSKNYIFRGAKPQNIRNYIIVFALFYKLNSVIAASDLVYGFQVIKIKFITVSFLQDIPEPRLW